MDIIEIAKECGANLTGNSNHFFISHWGGQGVQQFAQRIERPLLNQIENQKLNCEIAYKYGFAMRDLVIARDAQIEQLREALLQCKGFVDAYGQPVTKEIVHKALEGTNGK